MTDETDTVPASEPAAEPAPEPQSDASSNEASGNKPLWVGAAVGIGSAAIVAALLFTRRKK
jgi:hypothetical protein